MIRPFISLLHCAKGRTLLLSVMLFCTNLCAQEKLSLNEAIRIALEKNHGVQTATLLQSQAELNNSAGAAGLLPLVTMEAGYNRNDLNLSQKLSDGRLIERNAATSETYSANARLSWTLFDGLVMFSRQSRLSSLEEESRLSLKLQMEETIQRVIAAYFAVELEQENLLALDELLKVDSIRVLLAEIRLQAGNGARPELLQARLEQNIHRGQRLSRMSQLDGQKENLNVLLGRDPATLFSTTDTVSLADLRADESTRSADLRLKLAEQQRQTAFQWLKEAKGGRLPVITFDANYAYNRTENEAGFLLRNQNDGPGFGLNLRWNLFDGFRTSRAVRNSALDLRIAENRLGEQLTLRQQEERKLQRDYLTQSEMVTLELESKTLAGENLLIATERLRAGLSTALEIQEAQRSYADAVARLAQARYTAKQTETELLRLRGELLK